MSKTTRRKYDLKFKMRVALEVYKGEKALSQVASENGIAHYSLDWLLRVGVPGDGRAIVSPNPMRGRRPAAARWSSAPWRILQPALYAQPFLVISLGTVNPPRPISQPVWFTPSRASGP